MGASHWEYVVPYQQDLGVAFDEGSSGSSRAVWTWCCGGVRVADGRGALST